MYLSFLIISGSYGLLYFLEGFVSFIVSNLTKLLLVVVELESYVQRRPKKLGDVMAKLKHLPLVKALAVIAAILLLSQVVIPCKSISVVLVLFCLKH